MRIAELLRQLADKMDSIENPQDIAQMEPEQSTDDQPVMISPLQAKLELLKKGVGVESAYDEEENTGELAAIKKNAGISPAVIHIASDDEPLDM